MSTVYVNFTDATKTAIAMTFDGPQDPEFYPNQGTVDTSDAMWKAYYDSFPTLMQHSLPAPTTAST